MITGSMFCIECEVYGWKAKGKRRAFVMLTLCTVRLRTIHANEGGEICTREVLTKEAETRGGLFCITGDNCALIGCYI